MPILPLALTNLVALAEYEDDVYAVNKPTSGTNSIWKSPTLSSTSTWTKASDLFISTPKSLLTYDESAATPTLTERLYCAAIDNHNDWVFGLVNATSPSSSYRIYDLPVTNVQGMTTVGDVIVAVTNTGAVWLLHPTSKSRCVQLGNLPASIGGCHALAFHKGKVYGATARDPNTLVASLVEFDLANLANSRIVSAFSSEFEDPLGMADHNGKLYGVNARGEELWEINISDVDDDNDKIADLPSGMRDPYALVSFGNRLLCATGRAARSNTNSKLWDTNPTSPGRSTQISGNFPNALDHVRAMAALRS